MVKISAQGVERVYYLIWMVDENLLNITDVKCIADEKNIVSSFRFDWEYDDNNNKYYKLLVTALGETIPKDIEITFDFGESPVEIKESDKSGYDGMFDVSYETISRRYYIKYTAKKIGISDIYADGKYASFSTKTETVGDKEINVAAVMATSSDVPTQWSITPNSIYSYNDDSYISSSNITTTVEDSDIEGYLKKITLSWNVFSTVYYLKYEVNNDSLSIQDVKPSQTDESYRYDKASDCVDNKVIDVLIIYGKTASIPDDIQFVTKYKDATAQIIDSDISAYDKMIKISAQGVDRIYYLIWKVDENLLNLKGYTCIRNEKNIITNYSYGYDYDDDGNSFYVVSLTGLEPTLPDDLTFTFEFGKSSVEMKDSDKDGYEKMFDVSYETISRRYYLNYNAYKLPVAGVAVGETKEDVSYEIDTETVNDKSINVIKVNADRTDIPTQWTIYSDDVYSYDGESYIDSLDITNTVEDSDIEGYLKKVTLSWNEFSTVYYIKYVTKE